jgi:hypothetical protein
VGHRPGARGRSVGRRRRAGVGSVGRAGHRQPVGGARSGAHPGPGRWFAVGHRTRSGSNAGSDSRSGAGARSGSGSGGACAPAGACGGGPEPVVHPGACGRRRSEPVGLSARQRVVSLVLEQAVSSQRSAVSPVKAMHR